MPKSAMKPASIYGHLAKIPLDKPTDLNRSTMTFERDGLKSTQPHAVQLLEIFARHKALFLIIFLVLSMAGSAILMVVRPTYTAEATVLFDPRTRQVVNSTPVLGRFSADSQTLQTEIESELQRILSRRVVDPVIKRFDLLKDPEFSPPGLRSLLALVRAWSFLPSRWTEMLLDNIAQVGGMDNSDDGPEALRRTVIRNVFQRLRAQVQGHSTAIQISFWSDDPKKAAALVNAVADEYVQLSVRDSFTAVEEALITLGKRSDELQGKAVDAESSVEKYRNEAHLFEGDGGSLTSMQITQFTAQLVQAEADLAAAQARLRQTESVSKNPSASPDVLASPVVQKLREEEAKESAALAEARSRSGNVYPLVIARQAGLSALREQISTEINNIIRSNQAARDGALARVIFLKSKIADVWRQVEVNSPASIHLNQLKLEASVRHSLYENFLRRIQEVSQQLGTAQPDAQVISPAEAPIRPSWPNIRILLPCIVLVSATLAAFAVACADLFGKTFRSLHQVTEVFGDQPFALVPRFATSRPSLLNWHRSPRSGVDSPDGPYRESIHSMRVQLRGLGLDNRTILFSSAVEAEGKTATAVAFARQEAQAGLKVLMIDADLRRPTLHKTFGGSRVGLAELLAGERTFSEVLQYESLSGMAYISAGNPVLSPIDLLSNVRMQHLLREWGSQFDRIIVDSPAVLAVADGRILTGLVDRTIYIVKWGRTPRRLAFLGLEMLRQSGGRLIGPVFVQVDGLTEAYGGAAYVQNYLNGRVVN